MVALVSAAQRAHNLSWALSELGDMQARRAVRISERLSLTIFPIAVFAVGLLVAFVAFGMFMPLLTLLAEVGR
jgi:type II secretory pathway component PulF